MKQLLPFELKTPVLYVNPPFHESPSLIEAVSRGGGLGIVDHVTAGPAGFRVSPEVPHGARLSLKEIDRLDARDGVRVALIPLEEVRDVCSLEPGVLYGFPVPVLVEVGSAEEAEKAERAGAAGLVARGNEGPGWVSERSSLVLLQEILTSSAVPLFVQGGVGWHTAPGVVSAGAAGVVLDVHLLLTADSALDPNLKAFLGSLGAPATVTLGEVMGTPCRVYSRIGTKMVRELRQQEESLTPDDFSSFREHISGALRERGNGSPDSDDMLIPISESIVTARRFADAYGTAEAIVSALTRRIIENRDEWPFHEGSRVCRSHGTRFPIVQGPMAHVSDTADFLAAVASGGALPFLAMGNMPGGIARDAIKAAGEKTRGTFGVGLIGLEVNRACYEAHLEIMKEDPPPFAILAAGSVQLAQRIEEMGTVCYLHSPSPSILAEALKAGLRHFVFEGSEAGGHIGALGSLDLWEASLHELDTASRHGLSLEEVTVLLAGGIATGRASAFAAGMVTDLVSRGLNVGLQMGTAYLATQEAVSTAAVTPTYQTLTLGSEKTVVIGRTVNTRARAAASPMASRLIECERERIKDGLPLRERKELYEKDNLGALRLASKGCAIDPTTASFACPTFCDLAPEEQMDRGLYLMGQAASLLETATTVEALHREITETGRQIFANSKVLGQEIQDGSAQLVEEEDRPAVTHDREPIAVVGIGLRLPGSDSPATFWEQIVTGRSGIVEVPPGRWENPDFYYDPDPEKPDKTYSRIGGFVEDIGFDPLKYRIPPSVASKMDRTQQLAITCVAAALEDAGLQSADLKDRRVGIIIGNSMGGETTDRYAERVSLPRTLSCLDKAFRSANVAPESREALVEEFRTRFLEGLPDITEDSLPGELANVISGRVANVFNLVGPNFTVDAACASSMAAVMNAVAALREGSVDCAITGGVDAAMHPSSFVKFCKIGALSPDGSRPFDEGANGFVMGEGAGMLILKRLSDAERDGDRIYGTIVAIGSSSDGRGKGITAPNAHGQERAIQACFGSSRIPPYSIGLVEAHGTSTAVGDKTELIVLDAFFREAGLKNRAVGIGSVKSQIGHLKAAAGAAGMIKALLSLYHRKLPPTANVKKPNPCIDWESSPVFLVTKEQPWKRPREHPRRAAVSAFGFGGTNFHIILEEHVPGLRVISGEKPADRAVQFVAPTWARPPEMSIRGEAWVIGGEVPEQVETKIQLLLRDLTPENVADLAARCREEAEGAKIRYGFAAQDAEDAKKKLSLIAEAVGEPDKRAFFMARGIHLVQGDQGKGPRGVAFLFPGQGSQYPFMLRDLAERYSVVAETLAEADEILEQLGCTAVTPTIFPTASDSTERTEAEGDAMKDTQFLQPMILTANTAIFRLLEQFGVHPVACAGHSLGEYAACVAAGVFSFRDGLEAVAVRGREMARVSIADPGLMMSIPADARVVEEVLAEVDGYVVAANKNSPSQTVISGETVAVRDAAKLFKARGLEGVILPVSAAFHSGVVAPAREPFMKTLERLRVNPPSVPVIANVTGDFYPVGPAAPERIRDLLAKQFAAPVEWVKSLRRFYSEGIRVFVECGPKRVMTNLALDTLPDDILALPTNHPRKGGILQLQETLAALAAEGVPVKWDGPERGKTISHRSERPALRIVPQTTRLPDSPPVPAPSAPNPLDGLLDGELREIAAQEEFSRFLELQGEPIRDLIKSGFRTFAKNILPMERTIRQVRSEGMDFQPVVVSGLSAGLPSDVRLPFEPENLDDLIMGRNFIKKVPEDRLHRMVEKNIERLFKGPSGEAELQLVDDVSGVIKLAGFFSEEEIAEEYGLDERLASSLDITSKLALAAGLEALRDAGIPLVRRTRTTSTGHTLPDSWALPEPLRADTGVIFAAAFPGLASLVDEVTRETACRYDSGAKKRLIEFYTGVVSRIGDEKERDALTRWFSEEFSRLSPEGSDELYTFNRNFLLRVMTLASGQLAQFVKAQGPNTHLDAACASTTQALLMARDWIRTGQANRVLVVAADDVAGRALLPWIGSGFLAMGAATTNGNLNEAALPFDDRRNGLILGSAAVGMVLEKQQLVEERGMEALVSIETGIVANSAFHGTRLDVDHIASLMDKMIAKWEEQAGRDRNELADDLFFMSHETYSPKRGGSAAAEVTALRKTFGDKARSIPIANTKGFTGHTMGAGVEDVVAMRCLQKGILPPIANLKQPDPEFADLNLSRGGPCGANHVLRLAAGFGSQIVMALYKGISREPNRITDFFQHRNWLKEITGYVDPVISVEQRTLRVAERTGAEVAVTGDEDRAASPPLELPSDRVASPLKEDAREKILELLANKTGYPAEMLDTELDLEADLGIDTVKQAEFISEVREEFNIPRIDGLKIADFPTIEHIIEFVLQHTKQAAASETPSAAEPIREADETFSSGDLQEIEAKILELLSQKTGYPADMLDTDLDLEADLGIDTVKQAEFITEVRETFGIPRIEGLKIADFPTIRHIILFVGDKRKEAATKAAAPAENRTSDSKAPVPEEEIRLFEAKLISLPQPRTVSPPQADEVVIAGGPAHLVEDVEKILRSTSYQTIRKIDAPVIPADASGKRIGIINLFPMGDADQALRQTFELYLASATTFEQGPSFLVTVVSEDGAFGFENPGKHAHVCGAVAGGTKAFAREYPESTVRLLDVHPDSTSGQIARIVARSLNEAFSVETGVGKDGALCGVRLVPRATDAEDSGIRSGDVVLATGGARGITAACLRHLAERQSLTFVILDLISLSSRSGQFADFTDEQWTNEKKRIIERMKREGTPPTPVMVDKELMRLRSEAEAFVTVRDLRAEGSEVIYRSVDIRDPEQVDLIVKEVGELCGRVDFVCHAAGIDISRALKGKNIDQMMNVVNVKVEGMLNLLESFQRHGLPPRRMVGFGSVSGRFGNLAQADYSAANDGLAHLLRRADRDLDTKASIIDWAPWSQIGMATRGSVQTFLEEAGIDFVPPDIGIELFASELGRLSGPCEVVAAGRLGPFSPDAFEVPGIDEERGAAFAGQRAQIRALVPGEYLRAGIVLDPSHPLLDDHRIDGAAVLPGVGGIEIMRTATALLYPEARTAALEGVRFLSPLKIFRDEPFEAEIEIVRDSGPSDRALGYSAKIFSWFVDKQGRKIGSPRVHHECRLVPEPESPSTVARHADWRRSVRITEADIYSEFFHGPAFRFLDHVVVEGHGKAVRFRYQDTAKREAMFGDMIPGVVEAAFQAAAAFGVEARGIMALPTGIERAVIHRGDAVPQDGELIMVAETLHESAEDRTVLKFDGIVTDDEGTVILSLKNVELVELSRSGGFPGRVFEEVVTQEEVAAKMERGADEFLKEMLTPSEAEEFARLTVPKRAKEWITGRIALKSTVQRLMAASGKEAPRNSAIEIVNDDQGKPMALLAGQPGGALGHLSLSHSNGLAMAAASATDMLQGLGVDVEVVEARTDSWVNDYFTDNEIRAAGNGDRRWLELTRMWCLKEAALKAMGTGLRFDLREIDAGSVDSRGRARLEFYKEAARYLEDASVGELEAWVEEADGMVIARVLMRKAQR